MTTPFRLAGAILLSLAGSTAAHAGAILSPVSVVSNALGANAGSTAHLIDQTGLSANFISGETDYDTFLAGSPTHLGITGLNGWASGTRFAGKSMEFDLGASYSILGFALWDQTTTSAVKSFTLTSASDAAFTTDVTSLGTFTANASLTVQSFTVSGTGEFVRLQVNSNFLANNIGNANMGEVAFDVVQVPEPASFALLGLGFAGLSAARRSRPLEG